MRKVRMGMVGGGVGAFIGAIHRIAAAMDGQIELVCGAFSSRPEVSLRSGMALGLSAERCYESYQAMIAAECKLPASERMQFVAIVTPNDVHFPVAKLALESGFHVVSDKPATFTLDEAVELRRIKLRTGLLYGLTHVYTGYPMIKEAKARIAAGELGTIRKVIAEYTQGWLSAAPDADNKQAAWRLDPARSGLSCCMGDIGVHVANLTEYVCGPISQMYADVGPTVPGRQLDDDGTVLLRFANGAKGVLMASQVCIGDENNLRLRVYGDKASFEWSQLDPNSLWMRFADQPTQQLRSGVGQQSRITQGNLRTPAGHPEGYLEAFANLYRNFAEQIRAHEEGREPAEFAKDVPGIDEGVRGMAFINHVVLNGANSKDWPRFQVPELSDY